MQMLKIGRLIFASQQAGHDPKEALLQLSVLKLMQSSTDSLTRQINQLNLWKDALIDKIRSTRDKIATLVEEEKTS
eukprot:6636008-Pyramimonas_sp.AAC.1